MLTKRDRHWYLLAVKIAEDSDSRDKHGCVIVRGGCVVSVATNRVVNSHPVSFTFYKRDIHAEQRAIYRAKRNTKNSTLYSARYHTNPNSAPCIMCRSLLKPAGIKWIVFHNGIELQKQRIV